jgi:hypothetical protein
MELQGEKEIGNLRLRRRSSRELDRRAESQGVCLLSGQGGRNRFHNWIESGSLYAILVVGTSLAVEIGTAVDQSFRQSPRKSSASPEDGPPGRIELTHAQEISTGWQVQCPDLNATSLARQIKFNLKSSRKAGGEADLDLTS